jgi:hypothetical protein
MLLRIYCYYRITPRNPQHNTSLHYSKLNVIHKLSFLVLFQRVRSRATRYWSQRTVCSTTFTTRPSAGNLTAGMSQLRSHVRTVTSPYAASPCCCLAAYPCSRESNLFAVPSTSKVTCNFQACIQNFSLGGGPGLKTVCNLFHYKNNL